MRGIHDLLPIRPLGGVDASAQVDKCHFWKTDWEGLQWARVGCHL